MRLIPRLLPMAVAAALVAGCASNTRLDDGAYRPIGQQAPRQMQNYASDTLNGKLDEQSAALPDGSVQVQGQDVPVPDFPGAIDQARRAQGQSGGPRSNRIVRYGHPRIIDQIVKTTRIHCQPVQYRISTRENSFWGNGKGILTQCTYQFPKFCGGHQFSILDYGGKEVLVYKPKDSPNYVIDTLKGTPKSQPGLWDQDDHLGTSTTNAGYFFDNNYNQPAQQEQFNPASLGWIINASYPEEESYGKLYHQAVTDITQCF